MFSGTKKLVIIAIFTVAVIALVNLAWWLYYNRTETILGRQLSRRLAAVAQTGRIPLTSELVQGLVDDDLASLIETDGIIEKIRIADSLSEVFILDENFHYLATTLPEDVRLSPDSTYFLATLNGPYIDSLFFGLASNVIVTETYRTGGLYLKSAFASLTGNEGVPIAVLGVEASVDYFDALADLRRNLYYSTGLSVVGGVLLGLLFLLLQQRITRAEQQLYLGQTQAYLGRMVAVVAHELKNPLMIIRASAERLKKKTDSEETGFIVEEIDRLNDIVTGYLDFAKGDAALISSESPVEFDLVELMYGTKRHVEGKYAGVEIEWQVQMPESLPMTGYRRSLRQVLFNLLTNGVEACQSAGKPPKLSLTVELKGERVRIAVTDFGGGMSKPELKKIATPFYTTKATGSGLGLYLSNKLVGEMGGKMHLSSTEGIKTEAIVELPLTTKR